MKSRLGHREGESSYLLEYEKKKIKECAGSLQSLASVFVWDEKEEGVITDRQNFLWRKRLKENRAVLSDNLKEMANIMKKTADERIRIIRLGERKEKQIKRMFLAEGLILEDVYLLERGNGRKEAVARVYQNSIYKKKKLYSSEEVADFLSVFLNLHLVPSAQTVYFVMDNPKNMYFEEEPKYMVLTGFAKATKEGEQISGDNYSFFETQGGEFYALLSDGMGSGEKACRDSEIVVELAERFLDTGFSRELTVQMINDALIVGGEEKNMSTLDLCSINLHTGEAEFMKTGAAVTLLKRDSYVEKIPSLSLPLGVFRELETHKENKKLMDGDYIFLFSDGVADSFHSMEGEEFLKKLTEDIPYRRPSEMAAYLMKYAIQAAQGHIRDDMTVLVIGIWENENYGNHS